MTCGFGFAAWLIACVGVKGSRVAFDNAVGEVHDACSVLFGQLGVVRHHDYQAIAGDFGEQIHDLHARFRVKGAGGFVGPDDLRLVDQGARNGDALHLAARKLAWLFVDMLAKAYPLERRACSLTSLRTRHARKREGQFHVFQNGLMGNEVVCLEDEADAIISVGVPVPIAVLFGGDAIDEQVARIVMVEASDDIEHGRFARTRRA